MPGTISSIQQFLCPAKPRFTDKDVPDLKGKVIIVTGSNTGLGKEIAQIVYSKNAMVYMMARSEEKTKKAIESIKAAAPYSSGDLRFIRLDLADLTTIKSSADQFLQKEEKLHVLFNNAGVGYPDKDAKTKQGYELQLGVNCIGAFALTKLLTPTLISTAKVSPPNTTRVVWVSSSAAEAVSPKGFVEGLAKFQEKGALDKYSLSKLGNYLHSTEFATRHRTDGVISMSLNPGALDSEFWRDQGAVTTWFLRRTLLHPPVYGAYTNLFAAFSPEVTLAQSGSHIAPWGMMWKISKEMIEASKTKAEGGTGISQQFWAWTEAQVKPYL
ncbi:uncharacterized protein GGS22DRAFT_186640 [Annulohypoxylon maeteangense]|uniref:uncharacterized protein n=1 Tax=Annulohypoxylon maeteangense TaxID=1927788 RepID=UPI0020074FF4|nr:uncharacterized protein GGS22DRAFT_186640 [Annulohypoxylon maeteangense]KAI0886571.1 hypothetical protein GGS22DRAFT_186640 [Annulohypoxylon maeteangense]